MRIFITVLILGGFLLTAEPLVLRLNDKLLRFREGEQTTWVPWALGIGVISLVSGLLVLVL